MNRTYFTIFLICIVYVRSISIWKNEQVNHLLVQYYNYNYHQNNIPLDTILSSKRFEGTEHEHLSNEYGWATTIVGRDGTDYIPNFNNELILVNVSLQTFTFTNAQGINLGTYGDIVSYAGDFFGPSNSNYICSGSDNIEQTNLFQVIWNSLWLTASTNYLSKIQTLLQKEYDAIIQGLQQGLTPYEIFSNLGEFRFLVELWSDISSFTDLLLWNFDHFGSCAIIAYQTAHQNAIELAQKARDSSTQLKGLSLDQRGTKIAATKVLLEEAYAMNAFADHYLTDLFSSGHIRTPRKTLTQQCPSLASSGQISQWMHDEDNRNGLMVQNNQGNIWRTFGDGNYFSPANNNTWPIILEAVQLSRWEIFQAFLGENITTFKAMNLIPQSNSLPKFQLYNTCPLFRTRISSDASIEMRSYPIPVNSSIPCGSYNLIDSSRCPTILNKALGWVWGEPSLKLFPNTSVWVSTQQESLYSDGGERTIDLLLFLFLVVFHLISVPNVKRD